MVLVQINPAKRTIYSALPMQAYMLHAVKAPLMEGVNALLSPTSNLKDKIMAVRKIRTAYKNFLKVPEPTKENTWHPNTHALIEVRDWFCERCFLNDTRKSFVRNFFNFVIVIHAYDQPWRWMIESCKEQLDKKDWKPKDYGIALPPKYAWWREDKNA